MKKFLLISFAALILFSCNQNKVTDKKNDVEGKLQAEQTDEPSAAQAEQNESEGFIVTQNQAPGSPSMMTQQDNERVKAAYGNAIQSYQQGKLQEAADQFEIVLQFYPENPKALYYMGKIYYISDVTGKEDVLMFKDRRMAENAYAALLCLIRNSDNNYFK